MLADRVKMGSNQKTGFFYPFLYDKGQLAEYWTVAHNNGDTVFTKEADHLKILRPAGNSGPIIARTTVRTTILLSPVPSSVTITYTLTGTGHAGATAGIGLMTTETQDLYFLPKAESGRVSFEFSATPKTVTIPFDLTGNYYLGFFAALYTGSAENSVDFRVYSIKKG